MKEREALLCQLTQFTDAAGTRSIAYNEYSELQSDSLDSGAHTHLVTELQDNYGRSTGFTYARSGSTQFTTSVSYGEDGRIATAGFMHGGVNRQFSYVYLSGSNLLHTLTQPNGITLTQSYEEHRDMLTGMQYHRGSTLVVERSYSYDNIGRPTNRSTARQGSVKNDSFTHNDRSESARRPRLGRLRQQAVRAIGQTRSVCPEGARSREAAPSQLAAATLGTDAYSYDNIGNRKTAQEAAEEVTAYDANNLNQYTAIQTGEEASFVPTFDADGNQTKVQTSTGIWNVVYNAENRPVTFTSEDGATVVECTYDYMGRRHTRKITVNGSVTNHLRYIYRGYLQIAAINAISGVFQWFILWDPTQPVATRPLGIRKDGTWYTYGWDLTKNICEVFGSDGYIKTAYTYTPYGAVTANGNVTQPIQWSSEYNDTELGLVYYNYRHYNPADGRWTGRDPILEQGGGHLYVYVGNMLFLVDRIGLAYTVSVDKKACKIQVNLDIVIYPERNDEGEATVSDATMGLLAQAVRNSIESHWNGKKKGCCDVVVTANVTAQHRKSRWLYRVFNRHENNIEITGKTNQRSFVCSVGGKTGKWRADLKDTWVYAHEAGHLMGLPDDYHGETDDKGRVTSVASKGHENHMMATYNGRVNQHEVDDIVRNTECPCHEKP